MNELLTEDILQIAEVMADLFESDDYTVGEVCAIVGITPAMYRDYYETIDEFRAIVNRGKKARQAILTKPLASRCSSLSRVITSRPRRLRLAAGSAIRLPSPRAMSVPTSVPSSSC